MTERESLEAKLLDIRQMVQNFTIKGPVEGNLFEGYLVDTGDSRAEADEREEGPEGPEQ